MTFPLLALLANAIASSTPLVAFTVRFYSGVNDQRISLHQTYVADDLLHAGITIRKETKPWGTKSVWARDVFVGNVSAGKRWRLITEFAHPTSVAIQPE